MSSAQCLSLILEDPLLSPLSVAISYSAITERESLRKGEGERERERETDRRTETETETERERQRESTKNVNYGTMNVFA